METGRLAGGMAYSRVGGEEGRRTGAHSASRQADRHGDGMMAGLKTHRRACRPSGFQSEDPIQRETKRRQSVES
jgi:hypothetical protein